MKGLENLQPVQTKEEARERGRNGGIASGKARKEKKIFREEIEKQIGKSIADIIKAAIEESKKGNVQASVFLRDTLGEKPKDEVDLNNKVSYEDALKKVNSNDEY